MNKKVLLVTFLSIFCAALVPVRAIGEDGPGPGEKVYVKKKTGKGVLVEEGWMLDGVKTGFWKFYHENGKLKNEGNFVNNELQDWWKEYDEEGNLITEGFFVNGKKEAHWKYYYHNGNLMKDGVLGITKNKDGGRNIAAMGL